MGNFLPLEATEVGREHHKEHSPKLKLPKIVVSAAQIGNYDDLKILSIRPDIFVNWTVVV